MSQRRSVRASGRAGRVAVMLAVAACNNLFDIHDGVYVDGAPTTGGGGGGGGGAGLDGATNGDGTGSECPGIQLATDPHNCGRCGHDCHGGSCAESRCGPALVFHDAQATELALSVTADGDAVYWTGGNRGVSRVDL